MILIPSKSDSATKARPVIWRGRGLGSCSAAAGLAGVAVRARAGPVDCQELLLAGADDLRPPGFLTLPAKVAFRRRSSMKRLDRAAASVPERLAV
eukprot:3675335-Alexandrium_andersonii.AAC.1